MRDGCALWPGLLVALAAGCAAAPGPATTWLERLRPFQGPTGPDVVQLEVALIEQPVGDPYLMRELWSSADEQVVAVERRAVLEENGIRVGQIGGITPARFQALLTSEQTCINPRHIQLRAGNSKVLEIGPPRPLCEFHLRQGSERIPVRLTQASCTLSVQPSLTRDGRTRLSFTPVLRHGEAITAARPAEDRSEWRWLHQRPAETYTSLAWEVDLAPNDYLVVGARADRPDSLGYRAFVREDEPVAVQRLLVLRTNRPAVADSPRATEDGSGPKRQPSLAALASGAPTQRTASPE